MLFKQARPKLNLWLLIIPVLVLSLFHQKVHAEEAQILDYQENPEGTVEVYYNPDTTEPYRDRRSNWSTTVSISREFIKPDKFISNQDSQTYTTLFGSSNIPINQITIGAKYNFSLGALNTEAVFATGSVTSQASGISRTLALTKKGVSFGWTLDAIFKEPYVAPYVMGQVFFFDYSDRGTPDSTVATTASGSANGTTAYTTGASLGILIQLNSVDPTDAAMRANREFGLNNTFLDLFITQYNTSNSSRDPQLQTALNYGAGLRLEF